MWNQNVIEIDAKGPQEKQAGDENEGHKESALGHGNGLALAHWRACRSCHPASPLRQRAIQMRVASVHENVLAGDMTGSLRNEKENHVRDFLRLGHAFSQRNF